MTHSIKRKHSLEQKRQNIVQVVTFSEKASVLALQGCCNKLPQTGWLTTKKIHPLTQFQRLKVGNKGTGRAMPFPKVLGKDPFLLLPNPRWLAETLTVFLGLSIHHSNLFLSSCDLFPCVSVPLRPNLPLLIRITP